MKFIMFVKGNEDIEAGMMPDPKIFEDMGKYNNKLQDAGVLLDLNGLHPSSEGIRISFDNGETTIKKGPFGMPEELVEGYWIIDVESRDEALKWAKMIPFSSGEVEIRQIQDISEFPEEIQKVINRN
jgi:hypothetical protein